MIGWQAAPIALAGLTCVLLLASFLHHWRNPPRRRFRYVPITAVAQFVVVGLAVIAAVWGVSAQAPHQFSLPTGAALVLLAVLMLRDRRFWMHLVLLVAVFLAVGLLAVSALGHGYTSATGTWQGARVLVAWAGTEAIPGTTHAEQLTWYLAMMRFAIPLAVLLTTAWVLFARRRLRPVTRWALIGVIATMTAESVPGVARATLSLFDGALHGLPTLLVLPALVGTLLSLLAIGASLAVGTVAALHREAEPAAERTPGRPAYLRVSPILAQRTAAPASATRARSADRRQPVTAGGGTPRRVPPPVRWHDPIERSASRVLPVRIPAAEPELPDIDHPQGDNRVPPHRARPPRLTPSLYGLLTRNRTLTNRGVVLLVVLGISFVGLQRMLAPQDGDRRAVQLEQISTELRTSAPVVRTFAGAGGAIGLLTTDGRLQEFAPATQTWTVLAENVSDAVVFDRAVVAIMDSRVVRINGAGDPTELLRMPQDRLAHLAVLDLTAPELIVAGADGRLLRLSREGTVLSDVHIEPIAEVIVRDTEIVTLHHDLAGTAGLSAVWREHATGAAMVTKAVTQDGPVIVFPDGPDYLTLLDAWSDQRPTTLPEGWTPGRAGSATITRDGASMVRWFPYDQVMRGFDDEAGSWLVVRDVQGVPLTSRSGDASYLVRWTAPPTE